MANEFAITAASNTILLNAQRQAETAFTVSNLSGRPMRGRARLASQDQASLAWLTLVGEAERDFPIAGTQQYSVRIAVPPAAPAGSYRFRLDVVGVDNPDEEYAEGPTVTFQVPEPVVASKPFPWWILAVIAAVLLVVGGVVVFLLTRPGEPTATPTPPATAVSTSTPTPNPTGTPTPVPTRLGGGTGGQIAFYSDRMSTPAVFLMPVVPNAPPTPLATVPGTWLAWARDGSKLIMSFFAADKLAIINADGSGYRELPVPTGASDLLAAWSPDSRFIAFSRRASSSAKYQVWVMNSDGSGLRQLTNDDRDSYIGSWSPDGQRLAYMTDPAGSSTYDIWTMSAQDGSARVNLTNAAGTDLFPAWSPDGQSIAFLRATSGGFAGNLFVMDADGRNQRQVVPDTVMFLSSISWSPDNQWIVYSAVSEGNKAQLIAVHPDGTGRMVLTDGTANDLSPAWQP